MINKSVIILCGGKGLRSKNPNIAKSMQTIGGKSLMRIQIEKLQSINDLQIIFVAGWRSETLTREIELIMRDYPDINWEMIIENAPSGTTNALLGVAKKILSENVMILLGDLYIEEDLNKYFEIWEKLGGDVLFLAHPNDHPFDSDLVTYDTTSLTISALLPKKRVANDKDGNMALAGVALIQRKQITNLNSCYKDYVEAIFSLDSEDLVIKAFPIIDYIIDTGTPKRLEKANKLAQRSLHNSRRALFLDLDGTIMINQELKITFSEDLLDKRVLSELRKISNKLLPIFIVTNQPGISKGFFTQSEFDGYRASLETFFVQNKIQIHRWFVCPHHPKTGFVGEVRALKIECDCRKPSIKFAREAELFYNLNLKDCLMLGDSDSDNQFATKAGIPFKRVTLDISSPFPGVRTTWDALKEFEESL